MGIFKVNIMLSVAELIDTLWNVNDKIGIFI